MAPTEPLPSSEPQPALSDSLAWKVRLLLLGVLLLLVGATTYILYARGAFERTQTLVLVADHAEGVVVGMDLTFAGFPIGRVNHIELADDGNARIVIDVSRADSRWLRTSSVFTMESGLVGGPKLRAYSGILSDPVLPDGAQRRVLSGDASAEIPRLMNSVRELLGNLNAMTSSGAPLNKTLTQVEKASGKLNSPQGALGLVMGEQANTDKVLAALDRTNSLLTRLDSLSRNADGLVSKADARVFGPHGLMDGAQASVNQLNGLLGDARQSLQRVDGVLKEAQAIAVNTREATADLTALRADVEASLRKVDRLVNDVNRKWPLARDPEIKLP
jgi:phospholipid/cholesterol/gamma-HCH transport system substrate-binding protein